MKIAIIGSNGVVGCGLVHAINKRDNIQGLFLTHSNFEITDPKSYNILIDNKVDVVINTAAFLGAEPCENNPMEAFRVNSSAVSDLAKFCGANGIILAQVSTDGLFDGKNGKNDEDVIPNPINMYGLTKYNAEIFAKNYSPKHYIFRIPILFGPRKNNGNIFIEKMYNLYIGGKKEIKVTDNMVSNPSFSYDVAEKMVQIIEQNMEYGVYHIFNNGEGSLFDFASAFFEYKGIKDISLQPVSASYFMAQEKATKPLYTSLVSKKIAPLRDWKEALKDYCTNYFS